MIEFINANISNISGYAADMSSIKTGLGWFIIALLIVAVISAIIATIIEVIKWTQAENKEEISIAKKIVKIWAIVVGLPIIILVGVFLFGLAFNWALAA